MNPSYFSVPVISQADAIGQQLLPMTTPYYLPGEDWMLKNVLQDMNRGGIKYALVQIGLGIEVWR